MTTTEYVKATTHQGRGGRYPSPLPMQHAVGSERRRSGGSILAVCGAAVLHVSSIPFDPQHYKACPRCKELTA